MKKIFLMTLVLGFCTSLIAQRTITGTVKDGSDNSLMAGVSVSIKGTSRGTATDVNGKFSLPVLTGDKELVFVFLGMKTQTIAIGNKTEIDVTMSSEESALNEVVVTSMGMSRDKRSLPTASQLVDVSKMAEVKDQNIVSSLAGKIAGVLVTPPSSSTGSARIVIRGSSSLTGNNQPLFVIDGMQVDNSDGSTGVSKNGGLDFGNGIADITSDDIESINVLKGPNAAALYGSKAANGAIIITTKKAKEGRFRVSFNSNGMYHYISQWPDFQNAYGSGHMTQMIGGTRLALITTDPDGNPYPYPGIPSLTNMINMVGNRSNGAPMIGQPYIGMNGQILSYLPQPDNVYGFYQTAYAYTNNVAVEGGNADNNYRLSLTNFSANDVVQKQNVVNRNTLTLRFYNTLIKNLILDSKITITDDNTKNRRYSNQDSYNPLYMYTILPRSLPLNQLDYYKTDAGTETFRFGDTHNPNWILNESHNEDTKMRLLTNFDLSYQLLKSLKVQLKYGREYVSFSKNEFKNKGAMGSSTDVAGYYKEGMEKSDNNTYEWRFVYNERFFEDKFSILGMLGGSRQDYFHYWNSAELQSLKQSGFAHISNSDDPPRVDESPSRHRLNSLYGSASFGYGDYIYMDLTGRNDWSSTLPRQNNSYFYPSIGISFIPTELFKVPSRVAFGKLRASYAQVGNDTGPYRIVNYYNMDSNNKFNGYQYISIDGVLANYNLKPERTRSWEFGAELHFLDNRLNADVTYYKSNSFDQIVQASMASSSGFSDKMYNSGEIENKGWEVAANFIPIDWKLFSWKIDVNYSKNTSMVKSMVTESGEIQLNEVFDAISKAKVGYPYPSLWGRTWLTDQQGRRMVNLTNGEPVMKPNTYLGNAIPDFLFSIGNTFRYRAFDLYVLVDMRKGGKLFSGTRKQAIRNGVVSGLEQDQESYWKRTTIFGDIGEYTWGGVQFKNGNGNNIITNQNIYYYDPTQYDNMTNMNPIDPNYVPTQCTQYFWPGNVGYYSDSFDELVTYDASFVKLREVSVGYNLPKKMIAKALMSNARISLVGRNLWIFYQKTPKGLDPEAAINAGNGSGVESGSLPPATTLGFDVKISF